MVGKKILIRRLYIGTYIYLHLYLHLHLHLYLLLTAQFTCLLKQTKSKGLPGPQYNVMIGPEMDQGAFTAVQAQLLRQFNIHTVGIQVVNSLNKG